MCGILGRIRNHKINEKEFEETLLLMNHRGPDDFGTYYDGNTALGQTRLSILDVSQEGHQPMLSNDNNFVIVYNGEIYNFQEIRVELVAKGYKFKSNSDTEVILYSYIAFGEKSVEKFNGMFAFVIYNKITNELFMARDRSGIKPLYYFNSSEGFSFSSELKSLKLSKNETNKDASTLFLLLGYVPEPITIYNDVKMFPAGAHASFKNGHLNIRTFKQFLYLPKTKLNYIESVERVKSLLHDSIDRHLISDAPIGTFLSGGLDSSVITAIASKYRSSLQTVSLVFNEGQLSEEFYQDLVVKKYQTQHTKFLIDEKIFLNSIDDFYKQIEQPTVDGLNSFFVSKAANSAGLKTVLSGVGADEIFYGYSTFKNVKILKHLSAISRQVLKLGSKIHKYRKLEYLKLENEFAFYLPNRGLFSPTEVSSILHVDLDRIWLLLSSLWDTFKSSEDLVLDDGISNLELRMYMKNQLLRDSDLFGMGQSLEIRVPFLDNDLVDFVLSLDSKYKFDKKMNKRILVDAVKGMLPREVYDRPKMGFTLPFEFWFKKNIDKFNVNSELKKKFLNNKLHWSRIWAIWVLSKFDNVTL